MLRTNWTALLLCCCLPSKCAVFFLVVFHFMYLFIFFQCNFRCYLLIEAKQFFGRSNCWVFVPFTFLFLGACFGIYIHVFCIEFCIYYLRDSYKYIIRVFYSYIIYAMLHIDNVEVLSGWEKSDFVRTLVVRCLSVHQSVRKGIYLLINKLRYHSHSSTKMFPIVSESEPR